jgi:hypothetical protein
MTTDTRARVLRLAQELVRLLGGTDGAPGRAEAPRSEASAPPRDAALKPTATAAELDGKYGDPEVRFMPKNWRGEDCTGRPFSQCPPALLEQLASVLERFADEDEAEGATTSSGKPRAPYRRKDAALARGWARRLEAEAAQHRPASPPAGDFGPGSDEDIPF